MLFTSAVWQLPAVNFVFDDVGPVQQTLAVVEIQRNGVSEAGDQQAVVAPLQVNAADFVPDGKYDEGLEGICENNKQ